MEQREEKPRLDWLDYARFSAAMSVMLFHYLYNSVREGQLPSISNFEPLAGFAKYGNLGVDIFFMISGFVIFFSAVGRTPERFLSDRIVRLLPAFLVCMTITTFVRICWGGPGLSVSLYQYLANLTMMPDLFGQKPVDGVYWTLYREIVFYSWVFVFMVLHLERRAQAVLEIWIVAIIVHFIIGKRFPGLGSHAVLFASGCFFALVQRHALSIRLCFWIFVSWAVAIYAATERAVHIGAAHKNPYSLWVVAAITTSFFGAFLLFTTTSFGKRKLVAASLLGGLTYPLYLLHFMIGNILMSRFGRDDYKWLTVTTMVLVALTSSFFIMTYVERRPKRLYRQAVSGLVEQPAGKIVNLIVRLVTVIVPETWRRRVATRRI